MARDTASFYTTSSELVAPGHLAFALAYGGNVIHDAAAATGDYVAALMREGRVMSGSDLNEDYVAIARSRGLPVTASDASSIDLPDNSVDSVLLFEVLEHILEPQVRHAVLREARRIARTNVLITTPDSSHLDRLRQCGLTYEHMLDVDHKVFFTRELLHADLANAFENFEITGEEEIVGRVGISLLRGGHTRIGRAIYGYLARALMVSPVYFRFFVVAHV